MFRRKEQLSFFFAVLLGAFLAVGVSVWATTIGNNADITGNLSATGNMSVTGTSASSTVTYALGIGTSTPAMKLSIGGAAGNTSGHVYLTGGLGVGVATTTAGGLESTGAGLIGGAFNVTGAAMLNSTLGVSSLATLSGGILVNSSTSTVTYLDILQSTSTQATSTYLGVSTLASTSALTVSSAVTFNGASFTYTNKSTTTIATNADAHAIATSSANIPLLKLNASATRVGISTTTPGATLAVGGDGTVVVIGEGTSTISVQSTGPTTGTGARGGCIEFESPAGSVFRLYATSSQLAFFESGSCR